jgi:hypothetical protein
MQTKGDFTAFPILKNLVITQVSTNKINGVTLSLSKGEPVEGWLTMVRQAHHDVLARLQET